MDKTKIKERNSGDDNYHDDLDTTDHITTVGDTMEVNEDLIRERFEVAFKIKDTVVEMCDDDWYVDNLVDVFWDSIPKDLQKPTTVDILRRLILEKIQDRKDIHMKNIGLIEDDDEKPRVDDYLFEVNITDPGTVIHISGAGPGYLDVVKSLEEAAGSFIFYNRDDSISLEPSKKDDFNIFISIYDGNNEDEDEKEIFGRDVKFIYARDIYKILHAARLFMAEYKNTIER